MVSGSPRVEVARGRKRHQPSPFRLAPTLAHAGTTRKRGCPNSTGCPFLTRISAIVPETPAGISVNTFMASMIQTMLSGCTAEPTETKDAASGAVEA